LLTKIVGGLVFLLNGRKNRRFLCKFVRINRKPIWLCL
jgi:hypothetical protein